MEREKKIFSFENLYKLLTEPTIDIKRKLVYAGNNLANLNTKSDAELRLMLFNYVKMDPNDIVKVNSFDKNKLTLLASKMELSLDELYSKLGVKIEEEKESITTKTPERNDRSYLYETEQYIEKIIDEYLKSSLPANEKAKQYVERMKYVKNSFEVQVSLTPGFRDSDRYKEVIEYFNTLKKFEPYSKNYKLGDYINQVNEKKYYSELSKEIDNYLSSLEESKNIGL